MKQRGPLGISVASGYVWAIVGLAVVFVGELPSITLPEAARTVVGGLLAAPFIGLVMGLVSRGFWSRPVLLRTMMAGGSLYCAVLLFVVASGLMAALRYGRLPQDFWFNSVAVAWASLVWTWFFVLLWPLSYGNHMLVSRAWDREAVGKAAKQPPQPNEPHRGTANIPARSRPS